MNSSRELMRLRKRLGLTQKQVADAVGVTDQTVSNWEAGRFEPRLTIIDTPRPEGTRILVSSSLLALAGVTTNKGRGHNSTSVTFRMPSGSCSF